MFAFIKDIIAKIQEAKRKREQEEAARRFKKICTGILTGIVLLCAGYFVLVRNLSKIFSGNK